MTTNGSKSALRVVIGSDNAGHAYKEALKETLEKNDGVSKVIDVGVPDSKDVTSYPSVAVEAARKVKNGEVRGSRPPYEHHLTFVLTG